MTRRVTVQVPATTANLGPGFDCLALALDLWNETTVSIAGEGVRVEVDGHGRGRVAEDERNLVVQAMLHLYQAVGKPFPAGLRVHCRNQIPLGSGLGSSGAAVLSGLMAANALLDSPLGEADILRIAVEMEGHPDNAVAAVLGGLVVAIQCEDGLITRRFDPAQWTAAVVVPYLHLPTSAARAALPRRVSLADAVFNMGRIPLVVEAIRTGDSALLARCMHDRIHQPYRLPLVPGAKAALQAALEAGAAAAALSGAGPGLVAFTPGPADAILEAMLHALMEAGTSALALSLRTTTAGARILMS